MVGSHCENMWSNNSGEYLGRHPTSEYVTEVDVPAKQLIIAHQSLR